MPTILHLKASPRAESVSAKVAGEFMQAFLESHPAWEAQTLDLFEAELPEFAAPAASAKYAVMGGAAPADEAAAAWKRVIEVVDQLTSSGVLVISAPMWNFSIPYRLKHYIDLIVQPGLTFSFSPETGYAGLVTGRAAVLILARGGEYPPGADAGGMDMQRPYLERILGFIGFTDIRTVLIEPTLHGGPVVAEDKTAQAVAEARKVARGL